MAGIWSGSGTVTLDDGSTERIRCRATYAVGAGGNGLNQSLTCASDSYKFNLCSNIIAQGSAISGTWSESSRNINGNLEGRSGGGNFQVVATCAGIYRASLPDDAWQQAVRRDQGREPVSGAPLFRCRATRRRTAGASNQFPPVIRRQIFHRKSFRRAYVAGTNAVTSISTLARVSTRPRCKAASRAGNFDRASRARPLRYRRPRLRIHFGSSDTRSGGRCARDRLRPPRADG